VFWLRFRPDLPFGDQQDAKNPDEQDGGLKEQRRFVDDDGAHHRGTADLAVQVLRDHNHRDQRGGQSAEAKHELGGVAALARQKRLDEDTDDGHPEHDQHRRQQVVFDDGCGQVHRVGPSAN
jgi:hypothetical protein